MVARKKPTISPTSNNSSGSIMASPNAAIKSSGTLSSTAAMACSAVKCRNPYERPVCRAPSECGSDPARAPVVDPSDVCSSSRWVGSSAIAAAVRVSLSKPLTDTG